MCRKYLPFFLVLMTVGLCGCAGIPIRGKNGEVHHLIVGIGIVSTHSAPDDAVIVTESRAIGVGANDGPRKRFNAGYSSSLVVAVPEHAESVLAEVNRKPFKFLTIDVDTTIKSDEKQKGDDNVRND